MKENNMACECPLVTYNMKLAKLLAVNTKLFAVVQWKKEKKKFNEKKKKTKKKAKVSLASANANRNPCCSLGFCFH